jgi:hypothetical protein
MSALTAPIDAPVQIQFAAFDADGITPLTGQLDGDFTKLLLVDDAVSANPVTVTEVVGAAGHYVVEFTPDALGLWYVKVGTEVDEFYACHIQVVVATEQPLGLMLEEIWRILGLDPGAPLCVSKTRQEAGSIMLVQTEVGVKVVVQREP